VIEVGTGRRRSERLGIVVRTRWLLSLIALVLWLLLLLLLIVG
jgi:hypothetical protein